MLPTLFHFRTPFGTLAVRAFGTCLALAVLLSWYLLRRRESFRTESHARLYLLTVVVALLGARIGFLVTTPHALRGALDMFAIGDGGLVAFFGVLAVLAMLPLVRRAELAGSLEITAEDYADALAIPGLLTGILCSVGAYLAGSDFGRPLAASAPRFLRALGTFPRTHPRPDEIGRFVDGPPVLHHQLDAYQDKLEATAAWALPVHPVQLYEACLLLIVALLVYLVARRAPKPSRVALVALLGYAIVTIVTDVFRGDPERVHLGFVTLPVVCALVLVAFAGTWLVRSVYRDRVTASASAA